MKIFINPFYFGMEFNETSVRDDIFIIGEKMSSYFEHKSYSPLVEKITIIMHCNFPFMKPYKRPKYFENVQGRIPYTNETFPICHELYIDLVLESFESLVAAKGSEVSTIIGKEIISYFEQVKLPLKIRKSFDKRKLIDDLRTFFDIPSDCGTVPSDQVP